MRAETDKRQSFNLYTREAGQGELEVTVEGPSKADLQFHEHEVKIFPLKSKNSVVIDFIFSKKLHG